jgi:cell division cycle 20-like protein 1, cofactor of APC complex
MSGLKNSPFGKRLRASHREPALTTATTPEDDLPATSSTSTTPNRPIFGGMSMGGMGIVREYGDRFVPSKDSGDLRTSYHLMEEGGGPSTPSKSRIIPSESDALKGELLLLVGLIDKADECTEQANAVFNSILHTEVTPPSPRRPISPTRPTPVASGSGSVSASDTTLVPPSTPTRRRLFTYNSPSTSNPATPTRRLDTPTDEAYSMSPVRAASRQLLESPRRQLRSICKTPYRVLDAPELADDFYLNLVDWSSTNVLGVGLGSCVYLWTAHNAVVSKLCNLAPSNDTISSVSWVQKGSTLAVGTLAG